jgi:DNA primase
LEIAIAGPRIGNYHCWRCNFRGRTFGSLLKKLKAPVSYRESIFKLSGDIRLAKYQYFEDTSFLKLPDEFLPLSQPRDKDPEYKNAMVYLRQRGILMEDIFRYNLGYCKEGEYEHHIIIPSYDIAGNLNFFIGRRYYDSKDAIFEPLLYKKPDFSMNMVGFESFVNYDEPLNLCEGVFDAVAIRNNAVPLFGKYLSEKLRESMIINGTKRVNMILDNDALDDAVENCELMMKLGIDVYLVRLDEKDPSILGFEKITQAIRNAKEFTYNDLLRYKLKL